jgi:hypothetical protein
MVTASGLAQPTPYKMINTTQLMGMGGIDYVYADSDGRRLYVPRGNQVLTFDLDTLKPGGSITNARGRGVAVDPKSSRGFLQQQSHRDVGYQNARNDQDH